MITHSGSKEEKTRKRQDINVIYLFEDLREAKILAPCSTQLIGQANDGPGHGEEDEEEQEAKGKLKVV